MALTPHDVDTVHFTAPPIGKRGYHKEQVDNFLENIAMTLRGSGNVSPDAINNATFCKPPFPQRGYNEDEVDAFLDLAAAEITRLLGEGTITLHQATTAPPLYDEKRPKRDGRRHTDGSRS